MSTRKLHSDILLYSALSHGLFTTHTGEHLLVSKKLMSCSCAGLTLYRYTYIYSEQRVTQVVLVQIVARRPQAWEERTQIAILRLFLFATREICRHWYRIEKVTNKFRCLPFRNRQKKWSSLPGLRQALRAVNHVFIEDWFRDKHGLNKD